MDDKKKIKIRSKMLVKLVTISFVSCLLTILIIAVLIVIGFVFGGWELKPQTPITPINPWFIVGFGSLGSVIIGIILSIFIFNRYLEPIGELKKMTSKVAKGDFTVQVEGKKVELKTNASLMLKTTTAKIVIKDNENIVLISSENFNETLLNFKENSYGKCK